MSGHRHKKDINDFCYNTAYSWLKQKFNSSNVGDETEAILQRIYRVREK